MDKKVVKQKKDIPKLKKKIKTKVRVFRFTEDNYEQLTRLSKRYGTNVSKIIDVLVEVSRIRDCRDIIDNYIEDMNSA